MIYLLGGPLKQSVAYWSDEDQCYIALFPDLFCRGAHGGVLGQVFKDLRATVAGVIESYKAEGKPSIFNCRLNRQIRDSTMAGRNRRPRRAEVRSPLVAGAMNPALTLPLVDEQLVAAKGHS